jgi:EAL domain-containing protein (putative c-di-GMP-specific phosphodiesterase class I)
VGYLEQMSFNTIKIDRSFVSGIRMRPKRQALLRSMIQMSHSLDLTVVCEGVETAEELSLLRKFHCDLAQGHHFDKGLGIEEFAQRWLPRNLRLAHA